MPSAQAFHGIQACVFDAYGTLFDVHSAVGRYGEELGVAAHRVSTLWRTKQLEYTWLRSLMGRHADFWQVTGEALDYAFDAHGIHNPALQQRLMDAYLQLNCYPEVPEVLDVLQQRGLERAILSNGTPAMLAAAVAHSGLGSLMLQIFSVEQVGVYKPDPRVYRLAANALELAPQKIVFLSANAWDAAGAAAFGFSVVWINRNSQREERLPARPQAQITNLLELPPLLA
jgi:2-haloacid dehalogenase